MNTEVRTHSVAVGWVGIIAAVTFCIMGLACHQADSSWRWCVDAFCEFGVSSTAAADYFAYGLVVTGALLAVFGIGKAQCGAGKYGYMVGGILFAISGFVLVLVGLLTKDIADGNYHKFFTWMVVFLFVVSVIATVLQEYYDGKIISVGLSMVMLLAVATFAILFEFEKFEAYAITLALLWIVMNSAVMILNGIKEGKPQ